MLRKKLTLALILYPSQRFSLWFFERIRCAVVTTMPVLLSLSHFNHKPQQLPSGLPSAILIRKSQLGQLRSPFANIIQESWCYNIRTDRRWELNDRFAGMKHRPFCRYADWMKVWLIKQTWRCHLPLMCQSEEITPTTYRESYNQLQTWEG